jgi:hypothetical protein
VVEDKEAVAVVAMAVSGRAPAKEERSKAAQAVLGV